MIPVLISAETDDFFKVISDSLGTIFDGDDDKLDQDFIRVLLRRKRILVIFDGLSEKSVPTAAAVGGVADVRALIVTTRYEHNLAVGVSAVLRPMGIAGDDIEDFISKYMKRPEVREKLSGEEIKEAGNGVKAVFVDRDNWNEVTPLIVTLVADHAFELWCRQKSLEGLAASTADAITAYVRRVDPREKEAPQFGANKTLIPAACALAKCCLSSSYAPGSVSWDTALTALENDRFGGESSDIVRRFIQNEVLEEYEVLGKTYLKFNLDPVAEYLAAMYWINHLGGDAVAWNDWLKELETAPGYPEGIQGFLGALEDCVEKGKTEFGVPDLVFRWTKVILPAEMAITDSINVPSSTM